ncbi:MAG: extracellular solute-binding protein [Eubacteriales bacterium]|nr:extracellular solute-binding protein [Eubacteriales bacterium]
MKHELGKKILSIFCFVIILFGAAEFPSGDAKPQSLVVWFDNKEEENNALREIALAYEKGTGVHVEIVDRRSVFDAPKDLVNNADVESGPDMVFMQAPDIGDLAVSGYLEPLQLDENLKSRFADTAIDAFTLNGETYGIGYSIETSGLIYNKRIISKDELPRTWNEFWQTAEKLTIPDGQGSYSQYGTLLNSRDMWFNYPIIREYGGYYYGRTEDTYNPYDIGLNNEGMLAYISKMKEAKSKGLVLNSPIAMESHIVAQFAKGNVAMIHYGLWSTSTFKSGCVDYGLSKLPLHSDSSPSLPLATVVGFVINAHSPKKELAKDFYSYLCSDENQMSLIIAGNKGEKRTGERNPACKYCIDSSYIKSDEILSAISEIGSECEPFPNIPEGTIWYNYTTTAFKAVFFGDSNGNEVNAKSMLDELVDSIANDVEKMNFTPEPVEIMPWIRYTFAGAVLLITLLIVFRTVSKARSGFFRQYNKHVTVLAWVLLAPIMLLLLLFYVFPIFHNIYISMTNYSGLNLDSYNFVGFYNYKQIFSEGLNGLAKMVIWTITFALLVVAISFVFGTWLATVLNKLGKRASKVYRMIYILPWVIPTIITLLMWQGLLSDSGPVNSMLGFFGIKSQPFLSNPWLARISTVVVMVWFSFPYYMIVALGFIQSISKDYYEAACLDGASRIKMFFHITLPIIFQAMLPTLIMGFIMQFNQFGVYMLTGGGPSTGKLGDPGATDLLITYVFNLAFNTKRYSMAAAYSVIIFLFVGTFSLAVMRTNSPSHSSKRHRREMS